MYGKREKFHLNLKFYLLFHIRIVFWIFHLVGLDEIILSSLWKVLLSKLLRFINELTLFKKKIVVNVSSLFPPLQCSLNFNETDSVAYVQLKVYHPIIPSKLNEDTLIALLKNAWAIINNEKKRSTSRWFEAFLVRLNKRSLKNLRYECCKIFIIFLDGIRGKTWIRWRHFIFPQRRSELGLFLKELKEALI